MKSTGTENRFNRILRSSRSLALSLGLTAIVATAAVGCDENQKGSSENLQKPGGDPIELSATDCEKSGPLPLKPQSTISTKAPRKDKFCALILAIDPTFLGWIEAGKKTYEYRKAHPADPISHIVFFDNKANALTAIVEVVQTLIGPPQQLADLTWRYSGTDIDGLMGYFGDRAVGYATELRDFKRFPSDISMSQARAIDPNFKRPYGYVFLDRYPMLNQSIAQAGGVDLGLEGPQATSETGTVSAEF